MFRRTSLPFELIPIEDSGFHLLIDAQVNGQAVKLLIDTGASRTVFDKERIHQFASESNLVSVEKHSAGLGTAAMETHTVVLQLVRIGGLPIKNFEAVVIDLSHVNQTYASLQLPVIDGVIGSDLLERYRAVLDYPKRRLRFRWEEETTFGM